MFVSSLFKTQIQRTSQKPNMLLTSIPKAETFSALVESAAKCLATADWSLWWDRNQFFADVAFVIVS